MSLTADMIEPFSLLWGHQFKRQLAELQSRQSLLETSHASRSSDDTILARFRELELRLATVERLSEERTKEHERQQARLTLRITSLEKLVDKEKGLDAELEDSHAMYEMLSKHLSAVRQELDALSTAHTEQAAALETLDKLVGDDATADTDTAVTSVVERVRSLENNMTNSGVTNDEHAALLKRVVPQIKALFDASKELKQRLDELTRKNILLEEKTSSPKPMRRPTVVKTGIPIGGVVEPMRLQHFATPNRLQSRNNCVDEEKISEGVAEIARIHPFAGVGDIVSSQDVPGRSRSEIDVLKPHQVSHSITNRQQVSRAELQQRLGRQSTQYTPPFKQHSQRVPVRRLSTATTEEDGSLTTVNQIYSSRKHRSPSSLSLYEPLSERAAQPAFTTPTQHALFSSPPLKPTSRAPGRGRKQPRTTKPPKPTTTPMKADKDVATENFQIIEAPAFAVPCKRRLARELSNTPLVPFRTRGQARAAKAAMPPPPAPRPSLIVPLQVSIQERDGLLGPRQVSAKVRGSMLAKRRWDAASTAEAGKDVETEQALSKSKRRRIGGR